MPLVLVLAHMEMMPRLRAEHQLETIREVRAGNSATIPLDEVKVIEKELSRAANPNAKRKRASKATPEALAAAGIGVRSTPSEPTLNPASEAA